MTGTVITIFIDDSRKGFAVHNYRGKRVTGCWAAIVNSPSGVRTHWFRDATTFTEANKQLRAKLGLARGRFNPCGYDRPTWTYKIKEQPSCP